MSSNPHHAGGRVGRVQDYQPSIPEWLRRLDEEARLRSHRVLIRTDVDVEELPADPRNDRNRSSQQ